MRSTLIRYLLIACGWLCVFLGVLGIVIPGLPTTPFMLLAATCFSKSSKRFHQWLLNNKVFGPIISDWQNQRIIRKKIKYRALLVVAITFLISILIIPNQWMKLFLIGMWAICSFFIFRLPTEYSDSRVSNSNQH